MFSTRFAFSAITLSAVFAVFHFHLVLDITRNAEGPVFEYVKTIPLARAEIRHCRYQEAWKAGSLSQMVATDSTGLLVNAGFAYLKNSLK